MIVWPELLLVKYNNDPTGTRAETPELPGSLACSERAI